MKYIQVSIPTKDEQIQDLVVALLAENGYEGFEQNNENLVAFIPVGEFNKDQVESILKGQGLHFEIDEIEQRNWNKDWEESFQPVIVEGFCTVRASFHEIEVTTPYEVLITPKMSFGTGHHSTTQLMLEMMNRIDFKGKTVFDFGTGTGILAILAVKLGADRVLALDNDEWSYNNAIENAKDNKTSFDIRLGTLDDLSNETFDIILANINRNILLASMANLYLRTERDGLVLMSGLLKEDEAAIINAAQHHKFKLIEKDEKQNWISLLFAK
jgi:ribosomal protein L11 methyltransferase